MKRYQIPVAELLQGTPSESILVSSGADEFHSGGAGRYGDGDLNFNDFDY